MFSVIVPIYNTEKNLTTCLESLHNQIYTDFEAILIDDGSTDGSGLVCDKFAKKDARFIVYHQKNRGVSAARNLGIQKARGNYIIFLDSDDYVKKDYLKSYVDIINKTEADIIVCSHYYSLFNNEVSTVTYKIKERERIPAKEMISMLTKYEYPSGLWMSCFRGDILKKIHLDETIGFYEDLDFQIRISKYVNNIYVNPTPGYYYRSGSETHTKFTEKTMTCFKIIEKMRKSGECNADLLADQLEANFIISNALIGALDVAHDKKLDKSLKKYASTLIRRGGIRKKHTASYKWIRLIAFSPQCYFKLYRIKHKIR